MKRTLTGIAAAVTVLGTAAPMAFAATGANGWNYKVANQLPIVLNGSVLSNPYELTGMDSGNTTAYFPVYYFNQALAKIGSGYSASWDGVTHTWAITAKGVDASKISVAGGVGTGNTTITVNGTVIKKINTGAAKDPAGGGMTTYFPAFYIGEIFNQLGAKVSFSGQTGLSIASATQTTGSQLSDITASGQTSGDGSSANPAVSLTGKAITMSTTLTDANGNPVANTAVQFQFSEYGNKPSQLPTVSNAAGTVISGTSNSDNEAYTAYTDANGTATLSVAGPAGQTYAYEVTATAPYQSGNMAVSSKPAYAEFVSNNQAAITPYASQGTPFQAGMNNAVPVTVALPPNADGSARANVLVTLSVTNADGTASNAYFTNASGANESGTVQVSTNASGIAQAWLNDANAQNVKVSATLPSGLGLNNPEPTYINFAQSGVAARVNNYSISSNSLQAGQQVTVAGQLVDAQGNAVANGQVLVVGNDLPLSGTITGAAGSTASGDFGYVTTTNGTSTTTDFPNVGNVSNSGSSAYVPLTQGISASSTTGDVVTADSNGNFSFVLTDTNDNESATFSMYAVSNGEVASSSALKSDTISFTNGTTLGYIALGGTDAQAKANSYSSLTGLTATNHSSSYFWVDPQNSAGNPLTGQSINYNVSVSNGGTVTGIAVADANNNMNVLPINSANPGLSSLTVQETYNSDGTYTLSVPGQSGSVTTVAGNPDFAVYAYNGSTGDTKVTISSGSVSSTADYNFAGGQPTYAQSFSPISTNISSGGIQKVTFTVEDNQGNAVPNAEATLYSLDANNPLVVTSVNGVALDQSENMGLTGQASYSSEPTPIFLGKTVADNANLGYNTVNLSGVVSWTKDAANGALQVYSDASGNVTLTLQNGGASFYEPAGATTNGTLGSTVAAATNAPAESFWTFDKKGDSTNSGYAIVIGSQAEATAQNANLTQQLGTINFSAPTAVVSGNGTLTFNTATVFDAGGTVTVTGNTSNVTGGSYSVVGPNNTANPTGVTLSQNGNGQETVTFASGAAMGAYTVSYSLNGASEATGTVNVVAGNVDATKSSVMATPATVAAGSPITISGTALDAAGNAVSGATVTGTFDGQNIVTATTANGSFATSIVPTVAQTATALQVNVGGATLSAGNVTVTAGALNAVGLGTFTEGGAANAYTYTDTVTLQDANGNPISGATAANFAVVDKTNGTTNLTVTSVTPVNGTPGSYTLVLGSTNATSIATDSAQVSVTLNGTTVNSTQTL